MSTSNGWDNFTSVARTALINSEILARENGAAYIEREHFLAAVLEVMNQQPDEAEAQNLSSLLAFCGYKQEEILLYAHAAFEKDSELTDENRTFSEAATKALMYSATEAHRDQAKKIGLEHLFIAIVAPQKGSRLDATLAPLKLKDGELGRRLNAINDEKRNAQIFTEGMEKVLDSAQAAMRATYCGRISPLHLLLGILENPASNACATLRDADIDLDAMKAKIKAEIRSDHENATPQRRYSKAAQRVLYRAEIIREKANFRYTAPEHVLLALLPQEVSLQDKLKEKRKFGEVEGLEDFWKDYDMEAIREHLTREYIVNPKADRAGGSRKKQVVQRESGSRRDILVEFAIPVLITWGLIFWVSRAGINANSSTPQWLAIMGLLVVLIASGIFAMGANLFSKNKALKERSIRIFLSVLVGLFLGAANAGRR